MSVILLVDGPRYLSAGTAGGEQVRHARFIEGQDRQQITLMPECLNDFIADDNSVRVIDAFVGELNLASLGGQEFGQEPPSAAVTPSRANTEAIARISD